MREQTIQDAIRDYNNGVFKSLREAAKHYRVPHQRLSDRIGGKTTKQQARVSQQALSPAQERMLVQWVIDLETLGQAPTHASIREMAGLISKLNGGPTHIGKGWVIRFLQRNPDIKSKRGRAIDTKRLKNITKEAIQQWFTNLLEVLEAKNVKTNNIWNMDEVGIALGAVINQTVIGSQATDTTFVQRPNNREWCTAIECISTDGRSCKPLLIFRARHVQQQWFIPSDVPDWIFTSSSSAFTTNEIGLKWLQEIFIPEVRQNLPTEEWVLLLLDGHKSHVTEDLMRFAYTQRVWCYYLIAHASHILQPLDLAVFSSLKRKFRLLVAADAEMDDDSPLKKQRFIEQWKIAREGAITPTNCASGFRAAGIEPWDPDKALNSRFVIDVINKRPQTPPQTTSTLTPDIWDSTMTPRTGRHLLQALSELSKDSRLDRTVRTLLTKSSKRLDKLIFDQAASYREIKVLRRKLNDLRGKRKRKQPTNPNKSFIDVNDIQVAAFGPPVRLAPAIASSVPSRPVAAPLDDASTPADPMTAAIALFKQVLVAARNI
jgi:hypothetical protein